MKNILRTWQHIFFLNAAKDLMRILIVKIDCWENTINIDQFMFFDI